MHGSTAKFRDSVMRWEPFEARLCASSVSAASHASSFVAPLSMSYDKTNALGNYVRIHACTHLCACFVLMYNVKATYRRMYIVENSQEKLSVIRLAYLDFTFLITVALKLNLSLKYISHFL